ncbi:putative jacalin-like lectin domain-containing protein [Rosa chinensis]|uniref:Putative jacalin-like lectin domain-containing protein n=1 Tax=Rosa chinensis TaxID=74649 RepID=A0A2P6RXT7_ROSCH|nr:putative jacalin-like lectin domain-containing protein [Rosa chinensis]
MQESGKDNASGKRKTIVLGPWGGNGGNVWDDGLYHGVREITLVYGHCIDSIVVVYDKNGKPVTSEKHGGLGGNRTAEIKLQYPDEFLVSVSGHYCPVVYGGSPVIRSLKFESNRRTFGTFGVEEGTPFTFTVDGGKIVGLKGRGGWYLDAIGFHVCHAPKGKLFRRVQKSFRRLASTVSKPLATKETEKTTAECRN